MKLYLFFFMAGVAFGWYSNALELETTYKSLQTAEHPKSIRGPASIGVLNPLKQVKKLKQKKPLHKNLPIKNLIKSKQPPLIALEEIAKLDSCPQLKHFDNSLLLKIDHLGRVREVKNHNGRKINRNHFSKCQFIPYKSEGKKPIEVQARYTPLKKSAFELVAPEDIKKLVEPTTTR